MPLPLDSLQVLQVDIKEDEEQQIKFQEIVELLVASGYFRSRIKGLSQFDKVVGGMIWGISVCSYEIDVDIFFKENATIGQKIALTEKIVLSLKKMKCPYPLQPHQIQGLDFRHIFPVVQWLMKMAMESRKGCSDINRQRAIHNFYNQHSFMGPKITHAVENVLLNIKDIENKEGVVRKWKRIGNDEGMDSGKRIHSVLLEYGRKEWLESSQSVDDHKQSFSNSTQTSVQQKNVVELMGQMTALPQLSKDHKDLTILKEAAQQINLFKEIYSNELSGEVKKTQSINEIKQLKVQLSNSLKMLEIEKNDAEKEEAEIKQHFDELIKEAEKIDAAELEAQKVSEEAGNQESVQMLTQLANEREELKKEEARFTQKCQEERSKLHKTIEKLKDRNNDQNNITLQEVKKQLNDEMEKLNKNRIFLARKHREISVLQRSIDDIPSRYELAQYQARFIELHNQMAQKHKETKQFFNLHNTCEDTRLYLDKEVTLLNSIHENFEKAMTTEAGKKAFMKQLVDIVDGVVNNKNKIEMKLEEEQARLRVMEADLLRHHKQEAAYYAAVKCFQEECRKQELITSKIESLRASKNT